MKFKDEVYGIHILIFVMRTAPVLNENTMKNVALKEQLSWTIVSRYGHITRHSKAMFSRLDSVRWEI